MKNTSKTKGNPPGLSSITDYKDSSQDITKIGSRKRVDQAKPNPPKQPASTPTKNISPTPKAPIPKSATAPITDNIPPTTASDNLYTTSDFKVGDNNYYVVDDNTNARNMIKWDDKGNIAIDSPVQVIGKNASGGFILAADESIKDVSKSKFPYSQQGINFSAFESEFNDGSSPTMQNIHKGSFTSMDEVSNPKAASKLRGIYKRTGQY